MAAKIQGEILERMRAAIEPIDVEENRARYRVGDFPRADQVKDLDRRYRWDLMWASGLYGTLDLTGFSDAHIDTALRSIVSPLGS